MLGRQVELACLLEVAAAKPGNITPTHDFHDTTFEDMLRSAIAVGPELARAGERGVGDTVLAVVTPNLPAKPDTVISNKVTIKGEKQAVQLFGPAQAAVARAVVDSVADGTIPKDQVDDLCIIVGVFIHWEAEDDKKIYDYNYEAVKMSIARALKGEPSIDQVLSDTPAARHPFAGGAEG